MPGGEKNTELITWSEISPPCVSAKEKNEVSTKARTNIVGQTERYPQDETDK